ncbi:MAG: hypothetical protein EU518_01660 [Promethearchaeota archaeon]|nr:MAG: hypothetical protein EU518_01660 [Candidatus Lokiarchaeota archaeon]
MSDDRLIELRVDNRRLKQEVENLENKILTLVGNVEIEISGGPNNNNLINDDIINLLGSTNNQLNILSSKIDRFYTNELKNLVNKGFEIRVVTFERSNIPSEFLEYYDELKNERKIKVINNPNVNCLLVFNEKEAIYTQGSLDKKELQESILIQTKVKSITTLETIREFFNLFLPSFMR